MANCIELIYDRFAIDFFPMSGLTFKLPQTVEDKVPTGVSILEEMCYLSVGNFTAHDSTHIKANDTYDEITTTVEESREDETYTVNIHFEFKNPTAEAVSLCQAMDYTPYHVRIRSLALNGDTAQTAVIRNGIGQSRTTVTVTPALVLVDIKIVNKSGIQPILS